MVWRIWTAYGAVIALVLSVFSALTILQYDAVLSQLIRQRLSIIVETTAQPFHSIAELGLPLSMVRNAEDLLGRAEKTDPAITAIYAFNSSGIVVDAAGTRRPERISDAEARAQSESANGKWSLETEEALISGVSIKGASGAVIGGVSVRYPKDELLQKSRSLAERVALAAIALWLVFAGFAWGALKLRLRHTMHQLAQVEAMAEGVDASDSIAAPSQAIADTSGFGDTTLPELSATLHKARAQYQTARKSLASLLPAGDLKEGVEKVAAEANGKAAPKLIGLPETALSRGMARRLTPVLAILVLGSTLALGYLAYTSILRSFIPEFDKRAALIGSIASTDIQRAVAAGVPLDNLVGGSEYFDDLLHDFPDVSYFAVVADKTLLEVGRKETAPVSSPAAFPIVRDGATIGTILVEANPRYLASKFRDLLLDLAVVVIVVVLFAYELIVVMMASTVTGPFARLQYLAGLQARGDFSTTITVSSRSILGSLVNMLSLRVAQLNALYARACGNTLEATGEEKAPQAVGHTYGLNEAGARTVRFCGLADVRLPLFLFAMADELPLSFFSLYARAADNPIVWLSPGVVIGLPLAFYLLFALLGAPLARPLAARFGYRNVFLVAALFTVASNVGLYAAGGIIELIACLAIKGLGFALASLACQDYVLDLLPRETRARSLNLFRAALFSGIFAGTALGGIIADRMGQRWVFIVCAVLTVVSAMLIHRLLPAQARSRAQDEDFSDDGVVSFNLLAPLRNRHFAAIGLGIVIPLAIVDHVFISYLLSLQMDHLGASVADIGRMMMCFFLAVILAGMGYHKLPGRFAGPVVALAGAALLSGCVLSLAALHPSSWTMLLAAIGTGVGLGLAGGPQTALAMDLADGPLSHLGYNSVLGAMRVIERGGSIFGLLVVGSLTVTFGYSGSIAAIAVVVFAGVALFTLLQATALKEVRVNGE